MKKIALTTYILLICFSSLFAQVPAQFNFQAVIRDADGKIKDNESVEVTIKINQGSPDGVSVFSETHNVTTSPQGLISIKVGSINSLEEIDFGSDIYYLEVFVNGISLGVERLIAVPYAINAKYVENVNYDDINNTPTIPVDISDLSDENEILFDGSWSNLSGEAPNISIFSNDAEYLTKNDQNLGDILNISNSAEGNSITNLGEPVNDNDAATKAYVDELLKRIKKLEREIALMNGISDIEGNRYRIITIGSQVWMGDNLKTTTYSDGTPITNVTDQTEWERLTIPAYCWYNNDQATYKETFGALYNGYAVKTEKLCPEGWHVPTDAEWKTLEIYLGMTEQEVEFSGYRGSDQGGQLKEEGFDHWAAPNLGAVDTYGFTALPAGNRVEDSRSFEGDSLTCWFWTSTNYTMNEIFRRLMRESEARISRSASYYQRGMSVRCIKDEQQE